MLNAIYASKIFKSSTRQDRIIHAFDNPLNKALVKQLSEYVPDSVDIDVVKDKSTQVEDTNPSVESPAESTNTNGAPAPTPSSHGSNVTISVPSSNDEGAIDDRLQEDLAKQESEQQEQVVPPTTPSEPSLSSDKSSSEVKQTTRIPVRSAEQILNNVYDSFKYDIEPIKGILNTHADTAGVNRILIRDNEMWIYYNDDINLNNIMPNVIELLRSANYTYLEFNRLARSDNAIVFEIIVTSTINVTSLDPSKLGGDNK